MWVGFWNPEVEPSPKSQRSVTVPVQLDGVADDWNWTLAPVVVAVGAEALHDRVHGWAATVTLTRARLESVEPSQAA